MATHRVEVEPSRPPESPSPSSVESETREVQFPPWAWLGVYMTTHLPELAQHSYNLRYTYNLRYQVCT